MMTETSVLMVFPAGTSSETKKGKRAVSAQCRNQEESASSETAKVVLIIFTTPAPAPWRTGEAG